MVVWRSSRETAARVTVGKTSAATAAIDSVTPRRTRRDRSRARARESRAQIVPTGQPNRSATAPVEQALQVAEHERNPVALGEPVDLIQKDDDLVAPGAVRRFGSGPPDRKLRASAFHLAPPCGFDARADGDSIGDPAQPARERVTGADRARLPSQHQERGLECIIRIIRVG